MSEQLTVTWWTTFGSRLLLAAMLAVSVWYMIGVMPGIRVMDQLAADGQHPSGFELYRSQAITSGPYALTVLLPPLVWLWLAPVLGMGCLWFAKLRIVLNVSVMLLLAWVAAFFYFHAADIEKISSALE
jgi:hypothetical protein